MWEVAPEAKQEEQMGQQKEKRERELVEVVPGYLVVVASRGSLEVGMRLGTGKWGFWNGNEKLELGNEESGTGFEMLEWGNEFGTGK
ncbi:hypothetical protein TURU_051910 [Turdus rufiventris]|nr:hypothetical protein TURU_051910 [Turdus rufiventris]